MSAARQLDLLTSSLAGGDPGPRDHAPVTREQLDEDCWVDLARGWLVGADDVFDACRERLTWSQRRRPMFGELVLEPRLTAPVPLHDPTTPPVLARCAEHLSARYGTSLRAAWANLYRDGDDAVAWHADRIGRTERDPIVAVLTLGGPRPFAMRPLRHPSEREPGADGSVAGTQRASHRWTLHSGDLLVMGGSCQHRWEHTVARRRSAPPRISVTFRAGGQPGAPGLG